MRHRYLNQRSGIYYFRWRIPFYLVDLVDTREIKFSLKTSKLQNALIYMQQLESILETIQRAVMLYRIGHTDERSVFDQFEELLKMKRKFTKRKQMVGASEVKLPDGTEVRFDFDGDHEKEKEAALELLDAGVSQARSQPVSGHGMLFSELFKGFLKYKPHLSNKMIGDYQRYYQTVLELAGGDQTLGFFDRGKLEEILNTYKSLPARNRKLYKDCSVDELLEMDIPDDHLVSGATVSDVRKFLQGAFSFAVKSKHLSVSPMQGIELDFDSKRTYAAYTASEMRLMLSEALKLEEEWKKWAILIGAYTGARAGEILQLRPEDVKFDDDSNRYYFLITPDAGSVKTENSIRQIPIHQNLIDEGVLKFIDSGLFGDKADRAITRWFPKFRERCGVSRYDDFGSRKVFHSFRHTVITRARSESVDIQKIQQVVGHEKVSMGITDRYSHRFELGKVLEVIDVLDWDIASDV